jgi:hypothetical protein
MTIAQRIAELKAERRRILLAADANDADAVVDAHRAVYALDAEISAIERDGAAVLPTTGPKRTIAGFHHTLSQGIETIWLEGRDGPRMIRGIASTPRINSHGYALLSRGMRARFPVPLLSQHEGHSTPIGEVTLIRKRAEDIFVHAVIGASEAADHAWDLIERGETRAFSGASAPGARVQGIVDGKTFYDEWTLKEVSVCRAGANPDCHFEIFKSGTAVASMPEAGGRGELDFPRRPPATFSDAR